MKGYIATLVGIVLAVGVVEGSDFGYQYSYSCWKDCGYIKTQELSLCNKYQTDYCWVPPRRTIMIIVLISIIILTIGILFYCLRFCRRRQEKSRPTSPPPGSMCIWQA